ncbi:A disintegrin and metalloproteinase with thrombospondin motifs gon-1-like isoform X2 [Frieseomelitta varia]|uniref:A disintegrin and metalloproteinase with thrombospondin motifs gon-1-like isoform X2 n=1 Tax=Frieseomelitta varia TaxID=561572 RepID=UPI001CB6B546|nr:A disintegrin and metalloproteinase with thrombospondin motifs gon-1-like isoform X2 [Frieseomelitta varia]
MCLAGKGVADMSRISNRASTVVALISIALLVLFLVILWTGVRITKQETIEGNVDGSRDAAEKTLGSFLRERSNESSSSSFSSSSSSSSSSTTVKILFDDESFNNEVISKSERSSKSRNGSKKTKSFSQKPDLEYVQLMKISENQYEDPPDKYSTAKRHHSGHFRHATAEVWDPHPQYEFTAFGRRFRLRLAHDTSFVSPNITITHMTEDTSKREYPRHELGCFYSGTVDGDPYSAVTVSLCHGMTGHVRTSTGSYIIKPAKPWRKSDKDPLEFSLEHAIQRIRPYVVDHDRMNDADDHGRNRNCGVMDDGATPILEELSSGKIYFDGQRRKRRSPLPERKTAEHSRDDDVYKQFVGQAEGHRNFLRNDARYYSVERRRNDLSEEYSQDSEMESDPSVTWRPRRALSSEYFIEIMVAADAEMKKYHGDGLLSYILVLMSTVSRIYKDQSIGNPISISVMNIVPIDKIFGVRRTRSEGIAAADMLNKFCRWQQNNNPSESSPGHYDTALLLTSSDETSCDTLGLAELGRMCMPGSSCAIVQDNGLAAAFTIAHEIGHVLSMPHDDDVKCSAFRNRSGVHNIMSRMLDDNTFPWEWSKCSRHYVTEFLEAGNGNCLLDRPDNIMLRDDPSRLPGEDYTVNKQCELVFGNGSRICSHMVGDVCRRLWCTTPNGDHYDQCRTQHMPWADGTACDRDKWCHRGECVSRRNLKPVDGQWGEWGQYGKCSRTCGGGIKKRFRECNNPPPQNNGRYCIGDRVKYRSCGTKECPPGSPDFRELQCSHFDNNNMRIPNLTEDVKWHAKYSRISPQDRCKLYCQVESNQYYMLAEKVVDGTPCGRDTFHICVNGHCKPAGCDHVLNSTVELDICGVCGGDNSTCQWITGSYNSTQYGYTRVAKIPAGSNNIDIRQHAWKDMVDDSNYLALRLGENGKYILNGNFRVMTQRVIVENGVTIEYSGPESVVERLNTSRPIETDLILEVLSVTESNPPQISYEYTVPRDILESYKWKLSNWSNCSLICQGMKYRKAECRSIEYEEVVADDYCRESERPREESQMCNNYCILEWNITEISECSNHCGPGTRMVTSRCIQRLLNSNHPPRPIPAQLCAHLERPNDTIPCIGPCEDAHWHYGKWSACNTTCRGGIQYRTAICVDSNRRQISEENCMGQKKDLERTCGNEECPKWEFKNWSHCSVTCGIGKRHRRFVCQIQNRVVLNSYCGDTPPVDTEVCNPGPCEQWHTGDWSPCSVTCGEGTKRRKVICKAVDGIISDKCSSSNKPDNTTVCELKPCPVINKTPIKYSSDPPYEIPSQQDNEIHDIIFRYGYKWHVQTQEMCSRPCIKGYRNVRVKCVSIETGIIAPDNYCDNEKKPHTEIPCNHYRCPRWIYSEWTQCNVECGLGHQYRQVRCQSPRGEILPDENCHDMEKSEIVKTCRKKPCNIPTDRKNRMETNILRRWKPSDWSTCSKSCGTGHQRRKVECTMRRGNHGPEMTVKDEQCSKLGLRKPKTQRPCRRIACNFIWQEGPWSECSKKCGEGIQRRLVTCHRVNRYGLIDHMPSDKCPMDQKPKSQQSCKLRECDDKYYWRADPWKKCSHTCGTKGRKTRRLYCVTLGGKKVNRFYCSKKFKPPRREKCNERKCYAMSCYEAKTYFNATKDGEYTLVMAGRNMSIYCHGMSTSQPKEYLTLPAGPEENYAEINDQRLNDPYICPYSGPRNSNCNCSTSGKTTFRRVRIDPIELSIIENDYTFSRMTGSNRVEYGTAGDCNSIAHCPQGRFSINLRGTQLQLSSSVVWMSTHGTSKEINNISSQYVTGKCGGYCGFCKPKNGLKLDVLPP